MYEIKLAFIWCTIFLANAKVANRICGGAPARSVQFPFFAQLHLSVNSKGLGLDCGGALINPRLILTAAHCFPFPPPKIREFAGKSWIIVVMGTIKVFGRDGRWNFGTEVIAHPNFIMSYSNKSLGQVEKLHNDIALVRLQYPYRISKLIQTVRLPGLDRGTSQRCKMGTIIGIGRTSFVGKGSHYVNYATVYSENKTRLTKSIGKKISSDLVFYTEVQWCKGHALPGDSGGPYVCFDESGEATQYGICSAGFNSTTMNTTIVVVYEPVDKHMDFIGRYTSNVKVDDTLESTSQHIVDNLWVIASYLFIVIACIIC